MLFNSDLYIIEYGTGKNYFEIVTFLNFKQGTLRARIVFWSLLLVEPIHGTGKAFAGGKGFRGLCRLPAAKQTGKTGKGNGEILAIMCAILLTIK